jgi:uncharacterized protein (TIGR01777 family)
MTNVIITGGTGTIGTKLSQLLVDKGYKVIIFTRNVDKKKASSENISFAKWDIDKGLIDTDAIKKADFIINLAGASVAEKSWTEERKKLILESRTKAGDLLVTTLQNTPNQVKAVISASASGYYGADNLLSLNDGFTEDDPAANDFLGSVCEEWEQSIEPVAALGIRLVILRTGIVLSKKGGAYAEFSKPTKFKIAPVLGGGKQITSWIHEDDMCNIYLFAMENIKMIGAYNAVAPYPVQNKELIYAIARSQNKWFIPLGVPTFALRMAMGEMSEEILKSTHLSSRKIESEGFKFQFPDIQDAANDLARKN